MADDPLFSSPIEPIHSNILRQQELQQKRLQQILIRQEASKTSMMEFIEYAAFNPMVLTRKFQTLEQRKQASAAKTPSKEKADQASGKVAQTAKDFQEKNSELKAEVLAILRKQIKETDTKNAILTKTLAIYTDKWLADEAMSFLLSTTEGELHEAIREAQEELNENYGKEIRAGRNISKQAREFAEKGLGKAQALREMYRDIIDNPRKANTLFEEFTSIFSFENIEKAIDFLLHSLGADLKAKGSSISKEELQRLFSEARTMQAILQLFRFFLARMRVIESRFKKAHLSLPAYLTFDRLSKLFIKLLEERYPSADKVLLMSAPLELTEEEAQIIVFTQFRDATRHISPKFYRSEQHRQEVLRCILDALSELEDRLDDKEEEEQQQREKEEEEAQQKEKEKENESS